MKSGRLNTLILGLGMLITFAMSAEGQALSPEDSLSPGKSHEALVKSTRENNVAGRIAAILELARYHDYNNSIDSAIYYYLSLKNLYLDGNNRQAVAETCLELNGLYGAKAAYDLAMEQLYEALDIYESLDLPSGIAICYTSIGDLLYYENKYEESVEYCDRAISIQKELGLEKDLASSYQTKAASLLFVDGQLEAALETVNKAIAIYQQMGETGNPFLSSINGRGNILKYMERYDEAITDYQFLYESVMASGMENRAIVPIANIGHVYLLQEKWEEAIAYMEQAISLMKKTGNTKNLWENYYHLADIYENLGDFKKAYQYRELEAEENEAYYKTIIERLESEAQVKYETAQKDEQLKIQEEKIASQRKIELLYLSIALLLILSLIGMLRSRRNIRRKQKEVEQSRLELQESLKNLKLTQSQLVHAEKMASLGELTAGIAHEIQNPLNFVNNFSEVNAELMTELQEEIEKGDLNEIKSIVSDLLTNEEKINHHGKRADAIVKGMLQHSRSSGGEKELTDINTMADEYVRLAYHGLRAKDKSFNSDFKLELDESLPKINVVGQEIGRVFLNLINNAFYVVAAKHNDLLGSPNLTGQTSYKPLVTVSTKNLKDKIEIKVTDNGNGIPEELKDKIFQPFFTTKPTGEGTGLGLSMSYDIITKGHGGELHVESTKGEGSVFTIYLPRI